MFGFAPFIVRIRFTAAFLTETGIATAEQLVPPARVPAAGEYWPRRDGITFTVLRLGLLSTDENLIYWNDLRGFSTRWDHSLMFDEFSRPADPKGLRARLGESTDTPRLEIDPAGIGLNVLVSADGTSSGRKLAVVIPYCLFDTSRLRGGKLSGRKRAAVLKQFGWAQEEPIDLGEHGTVQGDFIHPYLTVAVAYI